MNRLVTASLILALSTAWALPAAADTLPAAPAAPKADPLDTLFASLKRERNEASAGRIATQIWSQWAQSGSATVDLLMGWGNDAIGKKNFPVALDFLDQIVTLKPDFAEGWNRRATVHYMMDDYALSMSDIDHTLALEPRHFGAMSGMAEILKATGHKDLALDAYERALAVYPMMRKAQAEVATLSDELAGEGI